MKNAALLNLVLAVVLVLALGWLLFIGRAIIVPIVIAVLAVYVMVKTSDTLKKVPILNLLPLSLLRFVIMLIFACAIGLIAYVILTTVREIAAVAPIYEANIDALFERIEDRYNLERRAIWNEIRVLTIDRIEIGPVFLGAFGRFTSFGALVFLVALYAAFLMAERDGFQRKLHAILTDENDALVAHKALQDINKRIGDYLAMKTLINVVLGVFSYVVLWAFSVDFAVFWAIVIAFLNYIPYFGSYIGVFLPVLLSLAQFGSISVTVLLALMLTIGQFVLGSIVEPRVIGRQLNLSPIVVLISLSVWTALWGISGAILAIPLTSLFVIVLGSFEQTRSLSLLFAERIDDDSEEISTKQSPL